MTMGKYYLLKLSFISFLIGAIFFLSQNTISLFADPSIALIERDQPVDIFDKINLADTIIFSQNADTILIDVRDKQFYNYAHIPGAINFPFNKKSLKISDKTLALCKKSSNIIIYGISNSDDNAQRVVELLSRIGITGLKVYEEGWTQWKACKLPIEESHE